ncbi:5995_t:CDS:2, partial [Cetraspora pellucida]
MALLIMVQINIQVECAPTLRTVKTGCYKSCPPCAAAKSVD